jgi:transposase
MEDVLSVYERPYDRRYPVICFDERPCQLIGDVLVPLAMKPGKPKREDYHYERNGTCCVLMTVEPLTGKRIVRVTKQKTKKDYAQFMKLVENQYPNAEKIILVQDNLNTHNPSSFYETFNVEKAFALTQRFEMVYTPKKASWLNMVEIDFSALSKQCLNRRIKDIETLTKEVYAWGKKRTRLKVKIRWQFTKNKARDKLGRFYDTIKN